MKQLATILALVATFATTVHAHPNGHDEGLAQTLFHIITEPDHLLLLVASLSALGFILVRRLSSAKK